MVLKSAQVKQFQNLDANGGFCYPLDILKGAFAKQVCQNVLTMAYWQCSIATCCLLCKSVHMLPCALHIGTAHCQGLVKLINFLVQSCLVIACCWHAADGFIDAKDLEHHLGRSSGVAALIKEADKNNDGKIDYQEFCDLLKNQHTDS